MVSLARLRESLKTMGMHACAIMCNMYMLLLLPACLTLSCFEAG